MALLSRELQWPAGRCLEASLHVSLRGRRLTLIRVVASFRGGVGTSRLNGSFGGEKQCHSRKRVVGVSCAAPKSLYETLGVPPTATDKEIKRAYRGLALKYHPDVNKQPGAQEKFLEIKNAYQTLVDSKSRSKYDAGSRRRADAWDPFQWGSSSSSSSASGRKPTQEEEFYGFNEFFRDLDSDLKKRSSSKSTKPKSLWEELADIGEEFVEFLEKELNISDDDGGEREKTSYTSASSRSSDKREQSSKSKSDNTGTKSSAEQSPKSVNDEIEDMLAKLKKEMGQ